MNKCVIYWPKIFLKEVPGALRLVESSPSPRSAGLVVRQHPTSGYFYPQGLRVVPVGSYHDIERRIAEGTENRTIAATNMNATSSRAHTVVTVHFDQIIKTDHGESKKMSVINLVDLAGKQRKEERTSDARAEAIHRSKVRNAHRVWAEPEIGWRKVPTSTNLYPLWATSSPLWLIFHREANARSSFLIVNRHWRNCCRMRWAEIARQWWSLPCLQQMSITTRRWVHCDLQIESNGSKTPWSLMKTPSKS